MAVTVTPLLTTVSEADATTGWTADGGWSTLALDNAIFREASGSLRGQTSQGAGHVYFTLGAAVDLTLAANRRIYAWFLPPGSFDTLANGGLRIVVGDGTNRAAYYVGGNDTKLHAVGSWICATLDINNRPSGFSTLLGTEASINFAAVTQIGIGINNPAKATGNSPNSWFDVVRYGTGLRMTGGTSGDPAKLSEIAAADQSSLTGRAYGVIREIQNGVYGIQGDLIFGDGPGTGSLYFKDEQAIVVVEDIVKGTGTNTPINIRGEHNATGSYHFEGGVPVGTGDTQSGRNGLTVVNANPSQILNIDFSAANLQDVLLYGCSFNDISGTVTFSSDATSGPNHRLSGCDFANCNTASTGRVLVRNCVFSGYSGTDAALLWSATADVRNCSFLGNTDTTNSPSGIEHPDAGSFTYLGMLFDGNDFDVYNSSGGTVTIQAAGGSNPTTARTPTGTTTIENTVVHTVVGLELGSRVVWIRQSDEAVLANEAETGGTASYAYNYVGDVSVWVQVLSLGYRNKIIPVLLSSADASLPAAQDEDRFYLNP